MFNNTSLNNEDWLTPSDSIFEAVEAEIYEGKKKENRWGFWIFFSGFFVVAILSGLYLFIFNTTSNQNLSAELSKEVSVLNTPSSEIPIIQKQELIVSEIDEENNQIKRTDLSSSSYEPIKNQISKIHETSKSNTRLEQESDRSFKPHSSNQRFIGERSVSNVESSNISFPIIQNLTFKDPTPDKSIESERLHSNSFEKLSSISLMPNLQLSSLGFESEDFMLTDNLIKIKKPRLAWYFDLAFGQSIWYFNLNENYQTQLQPADFSFTDGKGSIYSLGVSKALSKRFKLRGSVSYEVIDFVSGHNSSIDYILSEEDLALQNSIDLIMATPVGLIQSNLIIDRLNDDIINDTTSFIVDLSNTHRLQQFGFDLNASSEIFNLNQFSIEFTGGFGISYLSMIRNDNDASTIQHDDFHSAPSKIVSDQSNIKAWRPSVNYGLNLNYALDRDYNLGLSWNRKSDLTAVFKLNDFSTLLNRQHLQFYCRKRL